MINSPDLSEERSASNFPVGQSKRILDSEDGGTSTLSNAYELCSSLQGEAFQNTCIGVDTAMSTANVASLL